MKANPVLELNEALAALLKAVAAFLTAFDGAVLERLPSDAAQAVLQLIATGSADDPVLSKLNAQARAARDACTQWERSDRPVNDVLREAVEAATNAVLAQYRGGSNVVDFVKH